MGLSKAQVVELIMRNDGCINYDTGDWYHAHSYAELADIIEGWFAD